MAINLLEQPSSGVPTIGNSDYQKQNINDLAGLVANGSIFTDWTSTAAVPDAQTGAVIKHINNIYEVQLTDETISGSTAEGSNYVKATVSGSVMTLSFVTSTSGFAYYSQYDGIYNASNEQLLSDVLYKTGTTYYRSRGNGRDFNSLVLNNGAVIYSGGLQTLDSNIETGTGTINGVSISSLEVNTNGKRIRTGAIQADDAIFPTNSSTGSFTVLAGGAYYIPRGLYLCEQASTLSLSARIGASWVILSTSWLGGSLFADSNTIRLDNTTGVDVNVRFVKF